MNNPQVGIIILNWNSFEDAFECINSLLKSSYKEFQILIVDNASTDDSLNQLMHNFRNIQYLKNSQNLGYTGGNNSGIKYFLEHDDIDYIWILNPDTLVKEDTLEKIVNIAKSTPKSILSPKILYYDQPNLIWFSNSKLNSFTGIAEHVEFNIVNNPNENGMTECEWLPGTATIYPKNVFQEIGLFDDNYFLFYDDVDFCVRAKNKGYQILLIQGAVIFHKVGRSIGRGNPVSEYYKTRNRLYFLKKTNFILWVYLYSVLFGIITLLKLVKSFITKSNRLFLFAELRGLLDFYLLRFGIKT